MQTRRATSPTHSATTSTLFKHGRATPGTFLCANAGGRITPTRIFLVKPQVRGNVPNTAQRHAKKPAPRRTATISIQKRYFFKFQHPVLTTIYQLTPENADQRCCRPPQCPVVSPPPVSFTGTPAFAHSLVYHPQVPPDRSRPLLVPYALVSTTQTPPLMQRRTESVEAAR